MSEIQMVLVPVELLGCSDDGSDCPKCRRNKLLADIHMRAGDEARAQGELIRSNAYVLAMMKVIKAVELGHKARYNHQDCCVCEALGELNWMEENGLGDKVMSEA